MLTLPVSGELPASKTHKSRRWHFLFSTDATQPGVGTLSLIQGKRDADSYGIEVEEGEILFAKLDSAADVYGITCTRDGHPVRCSCTGFAFKKTCKHVDAARELIAEGIIDRRDLVTLPVSRA